MRKYGLRIFALTWLTVLLVAPLAMIFVRTFSDGLDPVVEALTSEGGVAALRMTLITVGIAVPLNTLFGLAAAMMIVRHKMPGRSVVSAIIDLPFAVSPVILGLALFLLYGRRGWFGPWLAENGIQVIFSLPGMVLAVMFVSLPFVVNELIPVLEEIGTEQEQAADTLGATAWQSFRRITLPSIRWGLTYGVVLTTARALGEYGAVSIVSGNIIGQTQTLPLFVEERFQRFDETGAFAAGMLLALIAVAVLMTMTRLSRNPDGQSQEDKA